MEGGEIVLSVFILFVSIAFLLATGDPDILDGMIKRSHVFCK